MGGHFAHICSSDAFGVTLSSSLFHYSGDVVAYLTKEDIGQFLIGEMLNTSIIQVYRR